VSQDSNDRTGQVILGRYTIEGELGSGGFAEVYRAIQHSMSDRPVAIKMIRAEVADNEEYKQRFLKEVEAVSRINHPHIVTVHEAGSTDDGELFLVMELLEGRTLEEAMEHEAPLAPERTIHLMAQVCEALDAAHKAGVIHRDLKPANIFLLPGTNTNEEFVKVLDFGIAKTSESPDLKLTGTDMVIGTPQYMSPEQIRNKPISPSCDIYTLGIILYELLTGDMPFHADTVAELMVAHLREPPPPLISATSSIPIPERLCQVVLTAMAKNPAQRPGSASTLRGLLRDAVMPSEDEGTAIHAPSVSTSAAADAMDITGVTPSQSVEEPSARPTSGTGRWAAAMGALLLAVGVVFWMNPWGKTDSVSPPDATPTTQTPSACEQPFFDTASDTKRVRETLGKALQRPPLNTQTDHAQKWKQIGHQLRAGAALWQQSAADICQPNRSDQSTDAWGERRSRAGWALEEIRRLLSPPIPPERLHGLATAIEDRLFVLLESGDPTQPLFAVAKPKETSGGFEFAGGTPTGPVHVTANLQRQRQTTVGAFESVVNAITDPVQSKDRIRIQLKGKQSGHVYVITFFNNGSAETIEKRPETEDWTLTIPEDQSWLPLRETPRGDITRIMVAGSTTPLDWLQNRSTQAETRAVRARLTLNNRELGTKPSRPRIDIIDYPFVMAP
jgi:tRNA A-37 threonylcarbamoyl transferase component Bud32